MHDVHRPAPEDVLDQPGRLPVLLSLQRPAPPERAALLRDSVAARGLSVRQLWLAHLHLGADLTLGALCDGLAGARAFSDHEYDVLAHALHEACPPPPAPGGRPGG